MRICFHNFYKGVNCNTKKCKVQQNNKHQVLVLFNLDINPIQHIYILGKQAFLAQVSFDLTLQIWSPELFFHSHTCKETLILNIQDSTDRYGVILHSVILINSLALKVMIQKLTQESLQNLQVGFDHREHIHVSSEMVFPFSLQDNLKKKKIFTIPEAKLANASISHDKLQQRHYQ